MLSNVARLAGSKPVLKFLAPAFANAAGDVTKWSVLRRVAPDIFFAGLGAATTPGDLGDKAIAFGTQAAGGILGGAGASTITRGKFGGTEEWIGGFAGDMLGQNVATSLQRGKDSLVGGEGLSAWERLNKEQQEQLYAQAQYETLAQLGLLPAHAQMGLVDATTGMGVA